MPMHKTTIDSIEKIKTFEKMIQNKRVNNYATIVKFNGSEEFINFFFFFLFIENELNRREISIISSWDAKQQ